METMMKTRPDTSDIASNLHGQVSELCKDGSHLLPSFGDTLDKAMKSTAELSGGLCGEGRVKNSVLENAAVLLWNKTVVMKTKGSLSNVTIAKLRNVAFRMVTFSCSSTNDELSLRKQILMGMKTSRAWIDCQHFDYAEKVVDLVHEMTQTLHVLVVERSSQSGNGSEDRLAVEEDKLKILCSKAEVFSGQGRHDEALQCIQMAKEYLSKFPKEAGFMSMLCYNLGVTTYRDKRYQLCTMWLRESFDLGKQGSASISAKTQARTLRLLASSYVEWNEEGCMEKALNAVSLANTEHMHPAGLFLKLRIMLKSHESLTTIKSVVEELMKHIDTGAELCHSIILLLQQHCGALEGCPMASCLLNRFRGSPDHGRLLTAYLDLLLRENVHGAKNFARECIIAHNTDSPLDVSTKKQFHVLFWEQAARHFEEKEFSEALEWYNYSLSLFRSAGGGVIDEANLPKLHRNRANCYIGLQQHEQAREALCEAKEADPSSVHTHFLFYKLALAESDTETATSSLEAMVANQGVQNVEENSNLICLAAQMAMEQKRECLAGVALSSVVRHMTDSFQVLKALRCLIRLHTANMATDQHVMTSNAIEVLLSHIRTASNKLLVLSETEGIDIEKVQTEAAWFMKIAWNVALKCEEDPANMKEFFMLCYRLVLLCAGQEGGVAVGHRRTCVLMATAASVQMARAADQHLHKKELLEEALHFISEYKSLDDRLTDGDTMDDKRRPTQILMLLYEFEALTKLGDPRAESVLERALVLPNPEPKLFESIAALAVDSPARQSRLSMRALKVAIHTHLQSEQADFVKCSKDIHQLIEQSLNCYEEEAFAYFKETADILDKKAQGRYPQMEVVWLMTKSWNTGIRHYCCSSYTEAERWCAMSMRLLPHIGSLRDSYEDQMMAVYTDILEGMERQRCTETTEE